MSIGGYFELEIQTGNEYHKNAIRLNSGRNAFEYILRANNFRKIYLPHYICENMQERGKKLGLEVELYHLDESFRPVFDFKSMERGEVFVYTNYFGICEKQVEDVASVCQSLIVDNSQAFYSEPLSNAHTFYSPRKFFGVPDGAYLYTGISIMDSLVKDVSYKRMEHLTGSLDLGKEHFYEGYKNNNLSLEREDIKEMSNLTYRLLCGIDYHLIAEKRMDNFRFVHTELKETNLLKIDYSNEIVPMIYPYLIENGEFMRKVLIENKIFCPVYWPHILTDCEKETFEYKIAGSVVFLPIDQRYGKKELTEMIEIIKNES